jgi:hypothetical protein
MEATFRWLNRKSGPHCHRPPIETRLPEAKFESSLGALEKKTLRDSPAQRGAFGRLPDASF